MEDEITSGMLRWEPGSLSTATVERILMDALADLWGDCYRRDNARAQDSIFREKVMDALRCATGNAYRVTRGGE